MKLYYADGQWQLPGQQAKGAEQIFIPATPETMRDWLNARDVTPEELWQRPEASAPTPPPEPSQPTFNVGRPAPGRDGGPRLFSAGADNDTICEAIEEAEGNALARIAEAVAFRFQHLAKGGRDAQRG